MPYENHRHAFAGESDAQGGGGAYCCGGGGYRVYVTAVPEDGKATKAVVALLAKHLGIAKSRLELVRGETARDKVFRIL
ncbi:MAG: DUF167 domain-containing protein [Blastochloris viridis]|uniref:DUF167 domain-containing protein n=1 Tax=Blastochloris viridis TaxID=1079 RepID=A0A6N4QZI6_BLAVI|nr:MAG: DUF167 domain-containing protein [Blastochloris viridis]